MPAAPVANRTPSIAGISGTDFGARGDTVVDMGALQQMFGACPSIDFGTGSRRTGRRYAAKMTKAKIDVSKMKTGAVKAPPRSEDCILRSISCLPARRAPQAQA